MTSPSFNVAPQLKSMRYTGSNATDIDAAVSPYIDFAIVNEIGGVLNATTNGNPLVINTNDWVIFSASSVFPLPDSLYVEEWNCFATCDEFTGLSDNVGELSDDVGTLNANMAGAFVRSMGVAAVPTLVLSGTATVAVQLQPAMPDSSYTAYASKFAGVSLTDLQINSVTVVDADTVNVAVENVGVATITGASVMVHAID